MLRISFICLLALANCTQPDGSKAIGAQGSPAWLASASPQAKFMVYQQKCQGYGFTPGTSDMAMCIMQVENNTEGAARAQMQAAAANWQQEMYRQQMMNQARMPVHCTTIGRNTSCY